MRSPLTRIAIVTAMTCVLGLNGLADPVAASASGPPVTCSKLGGGPGTPSHPGVLSGCTIAAKTGGKGSVVFTSPDDTHIVWKITWARKHGKTTVRFTFRKAKVNKCPKGFNIEAIDSGHITASSGAANAAIPVGQKMSAKGCVNTKTAQAEVLPGTKVVL